MTSGNYKINSHTHILRGTIFLLISVFFWGGSASLAKYLMMTRFDTLIIAQTRTSLSFFLLFLWFVLFHRQTFTIELNDLIHFIFLGVVGVALTNYTYYFTVKESSVATAILVQYMAPVWIVLYSVFISKDESLNAITIVSLALALLGCDFAVTGGSFSAINLKGWALLTGPLSSFTYAFQIILTKHLLRKYSLWTILVYMFGFSTIFWLIINPPWQILEKHYSANDWGIFWVFAVVSILIPQTTFAAGLKILKASTVGIISTMEPVFAIGIAYVILHESLGTVQMVGGTIVVLSVALLQTYPAMMKKGR